MQTLHTNVCIVYIEILLKLQQQQKMELGNFDYKKKQQAKKTHCTYKVPKIIIKFLKKKTYTINKFYFILGFLFLRKLQCDFQVLLKQICNYI